MKNNKMVTYVDALPCEMKQKRPSEREENICGKLLEIHDEAYLRM